MTGSFNSTNLKVVPAAPSNVASATPLALSTESSHPVARMLLMSRLTSPATPSAQTESVFIFCKLAFDGQALESSAHFVIGSPVPSSQWLLKLVKGKTISPNCPTEG